MNPYDGPRSWRRPARLLGTTLLLTVVAGASHPSSANGAGTTQSNHDRPALAAQPGPLLHQLVPLAHNVGLRRVAVEASVTTARPTTAQPSVIHRVGGRQPRLVTSNAAILSGNWSGQTLTGGIYTGVGANWTVPAISPSASNVFSATWIGIDGTSSSSLIQTGTAQESVGGFLNYFAWVELLPGASMQIGSAPVAPGDSMQSTIVETSTNVWTVSLQDSTQGWLYSQAWFYVTPGLSAEWIEEAPNINGTQSTLANFNSATFSNMGTSGAGSSSLTPIYMVNPAGTAVIAWPGSYNPSSSSFTDYYGTPPPVITSITPNSGPTGGGTGVLISGAFLDSTVGVTFGGQPASFLYNGDGTVSAVSPPSSAGTVDISILSAGGITASSAAEWFTYIQTTPPPAQPGGYDLVGSDGGVFVFGGGFYGSLPAIGVHVNNITGIVPTSAKNGYFLVGSDGGVFAFNAPFANSLPGIGVHVNNVVGIVPTLDNHGYFLVGNDGGVFSFNAPFANSLPGIGIHVHDIVGIAATSNDQGYWVLGSDGTVYAFGNAQGFGNAPGGAVGITVTKDGGGYWVVGRNGAVTPFGDAARFGDLPGLGVSVNNIVAIVVSTDGQGYNLFGSDGGVFTFGDASNVGSLPGLGVHVSNVVGAVPT